jgi:hypothetical protein
VVVKNQQDRTYQGEIALRGPEGWRLTPQSRPLTVAPRESTSVAFNIERGRNVEANQYAFEITATHDLASVVHRQTTFVASAPYFKPTIDGRPDEWKDAIPISFSTGGKSTVISTYWNRRRLAILIAVDENQLTAWQGPGVVKACDAVQLAISPLEIPDELQTDKHAGRFEFLLVTTGETAKCFRLASIDTPIALTRKPRKLEPLDAGDAEIAVVRRGTMTYYECSLSFRDMRDTLRPTEGREFYLSVLVHDPDGTGIRDLGRAAGLWPSESDSVAWSRWLGAEWGERPPRGNTVRWGLCTSKY